MINIFFVPGMFGSMIEMFMRSFSNLKCDLEPIILADGSCHSYKKAKHIYTLDMINYSNHDDLISNILYPFADASFCTVIENFSRRPDWNASKKIVIHGADQAWCEINLLFQWYKISKGLQKGPWIFGGNVSHKTVTKWNSSYRNSLDMRPWEFREWLSLFYPLWIQEWIDAKNQAPHDALVISNRDFLNNIKGSINSIMQHCDLHATRPYYDFVNQYRQKQQYVLDEYQLIQKIVQSVITGQPMSWQPLSLVGEAILQNHFRKQKLEWRCDGLDILPTNSVSLSDIVYETDRNIHA